MPLPDDFPAQGSAGAPAPDLLRLVACIAGTVERSGGRVVAVFVGDDDRQRSPAPVLANEGRNPDPRISPTEHRP